MVPPSVYPLVECLEALYRVVVGVFGQILDPEFEDDTSTFAETFMGSMRTHNPRMTPKVHVLVHHVPEYVRRTGVQFGSASGTGESAQIFLIFSTTDSKCIAQTPSSLENVN